MQKSIEHSRLGPREVGVMPFSEDDVQSSWRALSNVGIHIQPSQVRDMMLHIAMDAADVTPAPLPGLTSPSIVTPVQFLQNWLPGFVRTITAARLIDDLVGISTVGAFEDEEIVQGMLEQLGVAEPYGDYTAIPFSSWNPAWESRTVVRFEKGLQVGVLESMRAARVKIDSASEKRGAAGVALDIQRNNVGFFGYNDGANRTFGFLNDPNLLAALAVPAGAATTTTWATKTFLEITADIRLALMTLRVVSQEMIDPQRDAITMVLPTNVREYMTVTSNFGNSVRQWLRENFPNVREMSAPQLQAAIGGQNVAYFYAESVNDGSSDDSRTWQQCVPSKFMTIGVEKRAKSYVEDYANATAGVLLKRPYAVVRLVGV